MIVVQTKVKIAIGLAIAFIALNIVDILLTWQGLRLGAIELNFFMNSVISLGFFSSVAFKLGIASGIAAIMLHRGQFATLIIGVSLLSFVCVRNWMVIGHLS
jgi:hypothetical protein